MTYEGTVILVSHDREFLNQIVTRCLVFEGQGQVGDYVGGYDDWLRQRTVDPWARGVQTIPEPAQPVQKAVETPKSAKGPKLGYKEQRELDELPALIEKLETEQNQLLTQIGDLGFYQQAAEKVTQTQNRMAALEQELATVYARWEELEERK